MPRTFFPYRFLSFMTPKGLHAVSSGSDAAAGALEVLVALAEVRPLLGAAGGVVSGIEVQDQLLAAGPLRAEGRAVGRGEAEIRDRLAGH